MLEKHAALYILDSQKTTDTRIFDQRLTILKKIATAGLTILDFGCGRGEFTKYLRAKGYKALGYDKSKIVQKYLVSQHVPIYQTLNKIPNKFFDVITCFDVIEHTTDPRALLENIRLKIKSHGTLVLSTPNCQGISARILGKKWWVFGPEAHLVLFSPNSLGLLLENAGFRVVKIYTDTLTSWFMPPDRFFPRIVNKIIFLAVSPFQKLLFDNNFGDNILIIAMK